MANLSEIMLFKIYHCIFSIAYKNHASTAHPGENRVKKYLLAIELGVDKDDSSKLLDLDGQQFAGVALLIILSKKVGLILIKWTSL